MEKSQHGYDRPMDLSYTSWRKAMTRKPRVAISGRRGVSVMAIKLEVPLAHDFKVQVTGESKVATS